MIKESNQLTGCLTELPAGVHSQTGPGAQASGSVPYSDSSVSSKEPKSRERKPKKQVTNLQSLRKEQGKQELLRLVESGASIPHAKDQLQRAKGYKSRTTTDKWLKEDPEFMAKLLTAEGAAVGDAEVGMLAAAKGGTHTQKVERTEYFADGKTVRKHEISESFNPPNPSAGKFEIIRRQSRLRRIQKGKEKPEDVPLPTIVVDDGQGNEIPLPQIVVFRVELLTKPGGEGD